MFEIVAYPALMVVSLGVILFACELFTNGIEWTGERMGLSDGATGSLLAAVGTALPETIVPVIALASGAGGMDVAVGAIAGAPFMLGTLALFVSGTAFLVFSRKGRRPGLLRPDAGVLSRDLGFFIGIYTAAVLATLVHDHALRLVVAGGLVGSYFYYTALTLRHEGEKAGGAGSIKDLHLCRALGLDMRTGHIAFQVAASLALIVVGAHFFVDAVKHVSGQVGVPALVLSLIVTPVATELPEKMNSVLWIREGKDTLALGNITGAMVFQSSFPVAIGVAFTPWALSGPTLISALLALASAALCLTLIKLKGQLPPWALMAGGAFYAAFIAYLLV